MNLRVKKLTLSSIRQTIGLRTLESLPKQTNHNRLAKHLDYLYKAFL